MPPKGTPKGTAASAKTKKTPQSTRGRGRGRGKKRVEEDDDVDEEDEEEVMMMEKSKPGNKKTAQKHGSEDEEELDEEEFDEDDEERFDDEEDEEDEDEFDEDEEEEEESDDDAERPKKTLFIKNLPTSTTEDEVKVLSPDIQEVRLEATKNTGDKKTKYAVINFADEETANKNLEILKQKQVRGVDLVVDFVGSQSIVTFVTPALTPSSDPLKLYVTGFGREITIDQLKGMFPTCDDVTLPLNPKDSNKPIGYAFIHYSDLEVCRKAHDSSQELMYQNRTLVVMYGKKAGAVVNPVQKRQAPASKRGRKPKKAKKEEEEEEEDEEEEEEDGEENGGDD